MYTIWLYNRMVPIEACLCLLSHVLLCFPLWEITDSWAMNPRRTCSSVADVGLAPRMINAVLASSVTSGPHCLGWRGGCMVRWLYILQYSTMTCQVRGWNEEILDNCDFEGVEVSSHRIFGQLHTASRGSRGSRDSHGNAKTHNNKHN